MFFRKKGKYTDVEGYNRISRLIEDRQRDIPQNVIGDDDFDDESVLLTREPVSRDRGTRISDDASSIASVRPSPPPTETQPASAPPSPAPTEERRIPFQAASAPVAQPAAEPAAPAQEVPAMVVPDLGGPATHGSLVAAEAVWEGKLITDGNVRVEGAIHGEVQAGATVFVAANARIDGTIQARSILLAGEIEGQVVCSDRLEILPGGSARGEIETATLVVHEGAFIDSRFQMRKSGAGARG